jgi:transposase-like protein
MSRTRHTDKEKARIIREFEQHRGSTADFCRQRGVSYQTFMNWRRRPTTTSLPIKAEPPAFLEFELGAAPRQRVSAGPLIELELGGGIILRIHPARSAQP